MYLIFCIFVLTGVFLFLSVPGAEDLKLLKDENVQAGEGELCMTPTFNVGCQEGLTCVVIEKSYYVNGYCMKREDFNESIVFLE